MNIGTAASPSLSTVELQPRPAHHTAPPDQRVCCLPDDGQGPAASGSRCPRWLKSARVLHGDKGPIRLPWHRQVVDLVWWLRGLVVVAIAARYKGYRYPIEVIGHAVRLYHRFALSLSAHEPWAARDPARWRSPGRDRARGGQFHSRLARRPRLSTLLAEITPSG